MVIPDGQSEMDTQTRKPFHHTLFQFGKILFCFCKFQSVLETSADASLKTIVQQVDTIKMTQANGAILQDYIIKIDIHANYACIFHTYVRRNIIAVILSRVPGA